MTEEQPNARRVPPQSIEELLQAFRDARQDFEAARADESRLSQLGRTVDEKRDAYRRQLEDQLREQHRLTPEDNSRIAAQVYNFGCETPEYKEIESIHRRSREIRRKIERLRTTGLLPLRKHAVHSDEAKRVLDQIASLGEIPNRSVDTIIGLLEVLQDSAEIEQTAATALPKAPEPAIQTATDVKPIGSTRRRDRGPDIERSRRRVELEERLRGELGTIHVRKQKYTTLDELKKAYPDFELWRILSHQEQKELLTEEFKTKAYARSLVMRKYGLTSPETLKKDRQKLRRGTR